MAQARYTSEAYVKAFKTVGTDPDVLARLTASLLAASAYMEARIGRSLAQQTYTLRLDGTGTPALMLPYWPATNVTNLTVNGAAWTVMLDADADTGQECFLDATGRLLRARSWVFPRGYGNVQLTFTAGFAATSDPTATSNFPEDVQQATAMVTQLMMLENVRIGEGALRLGDMDIQSIARNPDDYKTIEQTIARWRGW